MTSGNRPLSPHLQVYRPQLTSMLSILHRITGIALTVGALLLVWWVIAVAAGPGAHAAFSDFIGHWFGRLLLFGWSFALFYHLCNGIRHLFWDVGLGYELRAVYASGWTVVAASIVLTLAAWILGYAILTGSGA